jgi:hypothetical protein
MLTQRGNNTAARCVPQQKDRADSMDESQVEGGVDSFNFKRTYDRVGAHNSIDLRRLALIEKNLYNVHTGSDDEA